MDFKHLALTSLVAALTTLPIGFIWYHPKVFGTIWMKAEGLTEEELRKGNMPVIFGLSIIFAFLISFSLAPAVIHQFGAISMVGGPAMAGQAKPSYQAFMNDYNTAFRTFKHGMLHGALMGIFFIFPITANNGLFSRKPWKLIFVTAGYWIVALAIMGGIICGWTAEGFHFG